MAAASVGRSRHGPAAASAAGLLEDGSRFASVSCCCGGRSESIWQQLSAAALVVIALGVIHCLVWHLHGILVPFVLSAFFVLALQPSVEITYKLLAGKQWPYRWCCCGCRRRRRTEAHDETDEEDEEEQPLLPPASAPSLGELGSDFADGLCRVFAVTLVLLSVLAVLFGVCTLLCRGAMHVKENWRAYNAGLVRLMGRLDVGIDRVAKELHMERNLDERVKGVYNSVLTQAKDGLWHLVNSIVTGLSEGFSSMFVIFLYILFWLLQPLPTGGKVGALVRTYIYMKTLVSFLYGLCVTLLFVELGVDLAVLFGVISFFFNFVPEVGAFVSMLVPVPVIVLDGRLERPFVVLAAALMGQLLLKFVFGNILEVKLIERDREMSIHPVWIILGLSYFGFVWGPTGMLISVPILALLKTSLMSFRMWQNNGKSSWSDDLAEDFLVCIEGRKPHKSRGRQGVPMPEKENTGLDAEFKISKGNHVA